jgi:plasmid stability protein
MISVRGLAMSQFVVRNLEDDIHQALREMAAGQGMSLEEYVREILRGVALERSDGPNNLGTKIAKRFAKVGLQSPIRELRGDSATPPSFEE